MKTKLAKREVIDNQLLVALDDKSKVAIIASEDDLLMFINGLEDTLRHLDCDKRRELAAGLTELKESAFTQ